jgi:competence protein ComEC
MAVAAYVTAGTVAGGVVDFPWWMVLGLTLAGLGALPRWGRVGSVWLIGVVMVTVATAAHLHLHARLDGGLREAVDLGDMVAFSGRIERDPVPIAASPFDLNGERWSVVVRLETLTLVGGQPRHARAEVSIIGGHEWADLSVGIGVTATGRFQPSSPGRIAAVSWDPTLIATAPATGVDRVIGRLRAGLRASASSLPPRTQALTIGMTIGDTSGMQDAQKRDMRIAGLTHLTAVSGAQFAMLALGVGAGARALRWNRGVRVALLLLVTVGLVLLVCPEPSVLRAAGMGGVAALALWWGRPSQAMPALSVTVTGLLLLDPFYALSYGFALSVVATVGIVLWAPIVAIRLARRMPPAVATALSLPIAAQVATAPILVLLTAGVGPYSVIANLLALPFAALVTALGLASVAVTPASPALGTVLAWAAGIAAEPVAWAAHTVADLPGAWIPWPEGIPGALLASGVSVAIIATSTARRVSGWARVGFLLMTLAVVGSTPAVRATLEEATRKAPADWAVAVCDVGQGDMILIRAGPSSAVVIDVGPEDGQPRACLSRHGVSDIPLLVLTHPHSDHDGGLGEVLARVNVAQAWISEPGMTVSSDAQLLAAAAVPFEVPPPGTDAMVGDAHITVWHAGDGGARTDSEVNESSLVVWGEARGVTFLSLGDLERDGQRTLTSVLTLTAIDVLKVAHHGSARQYSDLASKVKATLAVVSVGEGNPYGHPADRTLDMECDAGAIVVRTDECGDVDVARRESLTVTARCPLDVGG